MSSEEKEKSAAKMGPNLPPNKLQQKCGRQMKIPSAEEAWCSGGEDLGCPGIDHGTKWLRIINEVNAKMGKSKGKKQSMNGQSVSLGRQALNAQSAFSFFLPFGRRKACC